MMKTKDAKDDLTNLQFQHTKRLISTLNLLLNVLHSTILSSARILAKLTDNSEKLKICKPSEL